jgi:hypothetical protein
VSHTIFARRLAAIMTLIGLALVVVIAGWTIAGLVAFLACVGVLYALVNREPTEVDRYCSEVDQQLDRERDEQRMIRRLARQRSGGHRG